MSPPRVTSRTDERGRWLLLAGKPDAAPVLRAYIPRDQLAGFASEPAIDWQGSLSSDHVRFVADKSLDLISDGECVCEIWADKQAPDARTFKVGATAGIVGYLRDWSSHANVSLSIRRPGDDYPAIYVWGALRDAGDSGDPSDEVGIKLDRGLISEQGVSLVFSTFEQTQEKAAQWAEFRAFLDIFRKEASA